MTVDIAQIILINFYRSVPLWLVLLTLLIVSEIIFFIITKYDKFSNSESFITDENIKPIVYTLAYKFCSVLLAGTILVLIPVLMCVLIDNRLSVISQLFELFKLCLILQCVVVFILLNWQIVKYNDKPKKKTRGK